jgi:hypothetical protein
VSPVNPTGGVSDFLINVISVSFGFVEVGLIDISNLGQIRNHFAGDLLVSGVLLVSSNLGLEVLGL